METSPRGEVSVCPIVARISSRPLRACSSALRITSVVTPVTLMSICSAVTPPWVPATLKSMSP